jgi:hypothetical protein
MIHWTLTRDNGCSPEIIVVGVMQVLSAHDMAGPMDAAAPGPQEALSPAEPAPDDNASEIRDMAAGNEGAVDEEVRACVLQMYAGLGAAGGGIG